MSSREKYLKKSLYFIISVCLLENTVGAMACVWWSEDSQRKWALSFHLLRVMGLELRPGQGASACSPRACLPPFQVRACLSRKSHNRAVSRKMGGGSGRARRWRKRLAFVFGKTLPSLSVQGRVLKSSEPPRWRSNSLCHRKPPSSGKE